MYMCGGVFLDCSLFYLLNLELMDSASLASLPVSTSQVLKLQTGSHADPAFLAESGDQSSRSHMGEARAFSAEPSLWPCSGSSCILLVALHIPPASQPSFLFLQEPLTTLAKHSCF